VALAAQVALVGPEALVARARKAAQVAGGMASRARALDRPGLLAPAAVAAVRAAREAAAQRPPVAHQERAAPPGCNIRMAPVETAAPVIKVAEVLVLPAAMV
jgi:hypothetical protein